MSVNAETYSRSISLLGRGIAAGIGAAIVGIALPSPSAAVQPNHPGCLGHDISTYADAGAGFGAFVSGLAAGGAGDEIQAHLAGEIPDTAIPNSCND